MEFIETSFFTKFISSELLDDKYRELQNTLIEKPDAGKVITGSKGLRKLRWKIKGRGKRGGIRIIYLLYTCDKIVMLYAYKKSCLEDITQEQLKMIKHLALREIP